MQKRSTFMVAGKILLAIIILIAWHFAARAWWTTDNTLYDGNEAWTSRTVWSYDTDPWGVVASHILGTAILFHWLLATAVITAIPVTIAVLSMPDPSRPIGESRPLGLNTRLDVARRFHDAPKGEFEARAASWRAQNLSE